MKRFLASLALACAISISASAEVTYELLDRGVPTDGTTTANGYRAYTLRFKTDTGTISAIDLSAWGGIKGPLVQQWFASTPGSYTISTPGFSLAQNLDPSGLNLDSHLLWPTGTYGGVVQVAPANPSEDASIGAAGTQFGTFPSNSDDRGFGLGSRLTVAYGIEGRRQISSIDVAYIVLPDNGTIDFLAQVALANSFQTADVSNWRTWNPPGNVWNTNSANQNWSSGGSARSFAANADVRFTDAGLARLGGGDVTVDPAGVSVGSIRLTYSSGTYTFSGGTINSSGRLSKIGQGTLKLAAPSTFAQSVSCDGAFIVDDELTAPQLTADVLRGTGAVHAHVNVGTFAPGDPNQVGTLTLDRAFVSALSINVGAAGASKLVITQDDGLSVGQQINIKLVDVGGVVSGTYPVLDYAGSALPGSISLHVQSATFGNSLAGLINNSANTSVDLKVVTQLPPSNWNKDQDGDWSGSKNWSKATPNDMGATAVLGPNITAPRTVRADAPQTVGTLQFNSSSSYSVVGPGTLTFDAFVIPAKVAVMRGSHVISAPTVINGDAWATVAANSTLTMDGPIASGAGTGSFTKLGPGTLVLDGDSTYASQTLVQEGTLLVNGTHTGAGDFVLDDEGTVGGTLGGTGVIHSEIWFIGGAVFPGDGHNPGTLTVDRCGSIAYAAVIKVVIGPTGTNQLVITEPDTLPRSVQFDIVAAPTSLPYGQFALLDYGGTPLANLDRFRLDYKVGFPPGASFSLVNNTANTSVDLLIVPEPNSVCAATALFSLLLSLPNRAGRRGRMKKVVLPTGVLGYNLTRHLPGCRHEAP